MMRAFILLLALAPVLAAVASGDPDEASAWERAPGVSGGRVLKSCICPNIVMPVCGANGRTYTNACRGKCAGVKVASIGECPATGRKLRVAKRCVCPAIYQPVCGVKNGVRQTYSNACQAGCAGATIVEQDACSGGASTQPVRTTAGRKLAAATCICNKVYKPVCGANGKTFGNTCEAACKKAVVRCWGACPCPLCKCTAQYAPVCGADGVTYSNACQARCKRIPIAYKGQCQGREGDTCGGIAGKTCGASLVCDAPATPDALGVCRPAPGPADGALGGKCGGFAGFPCDQGLTCLTPIDIADAFGTCQYDNPVVGEGEPCGGFRVGPTPTCAKGLYCKTNPLIADAPGVCTPLPQSGAGETCGGFPALGTQPATCKPGLTCKTDPRAPDKPGVCQ